jgi:hypothetical protein
MKTVRLDGMTALISSVVLTGPTDIFEDDELAAGLQLIADDPDLIVDDAEIRKLQAQLEGKKSGRRPPKNKTGPAPAFAAPTPSLTDGFED